MKNMGRACLIAAATCVLGFGFLTAINVSAADQNPCVKDVAKFCKDVPQNKRAINVCLEKYESELSPDCREYEAKMEKARVESRETMRNKMRFEQACKDDRAKFCKDAGPAPASAKCLKEYEKDISASCKESVDAFLEHMHAE